MDPYAALCAFYDFTFRVLVALGIVGALAVVADAWDDKERR